MILVVDEVIETVKGGFISEGFFKQFDMTLFEEIGGKCYKEKKRKRKGKNGKDMKRKKNTLRAFASRANKKFTFSVKKKS